LIYGDIPRVTQGALYICAYWILFVITAYCYTRAAFGDPKSPSEYNIKIPVNQAEDTAAFMKEQYEPIKSKDQIIYLPRSTARMCGICNAPKPPRSHHCSTCKRCFLKMDHHCVWLDNCVGFGNYKYFFCLLFWGTFMSGFIFGATLQALIQQLVYDELEGVSVVWLIMGFLAFSLCVSTLMLLCYHSYLVSKGMTTIEHIEITEEREDAKRKERIRLRRLERETEQESQINATTVNISNNNNNNNNNSNNANDDTNSMTNLLNNPNATTSKPQPPAPSSFQQNYSEGVYTNFCIALGPNPLLWLVPINIPSGNGIRFRKEEATVARNSFSII
jgi:palmitoyltransferase ZDHHC2/15/20